MAEEKKSEKLEKNIDTVTDRASSLSLDDDKDNMLVVTDAKNPKGIEEIWFDSEEGYRARGTTWCYLIDESINEIKNMSDRNYLIKLRTIIYTKLNPSWATEHIQLYGSTEYKCKDDLIDWEKELLALPKDKKLKIVEIYIFYRLLVSFENGYWVTIAYLEKWLIEAFTIVQEDTSNKKKIQRWIKAFRRKHGIRLTMRDIKLQNGCYLKARTVDFLRK